MTTPKDFEGKRATLVVRNILGKVYVRHINVLEGTGFASFGQRQTVKLSYKRRGCSTVKVNHYNFSDSSVALVKGWVVPEGMVERTTGVSKACSQYARLRNSYAYPTPSNPNYEAIREQGPKVFEAVVAELGATWIHQEGE